MPIKKTADKMSEVVEVETGQESFVFFAQNLVFDLEHFESKKEYVVWYMAIALNLFMHNASHNPAAGYGKVQKLEAKHKLFYARSQSKHPNRTSHDQFAKTPEDKRITSVGSLNETFKGIIREAIVVVDDEASDETAKAKRISKKRKALLKSLSAINGISGFPKRNKSIPNYFSLVLAHGGIRSNNFKSLTNALEIAVASADDDKEAISELTKKFQQQFPKRIPKKIERLDEKEVEKRITGIQKRFFALKQKTAKMIWYIDLREKMHAQRSKNIADICQRAPKKFSKLETKADTKKILSVIADGSGCLVICINKDLIELPDKKGKNYLNYITNAILGFFCGLLNHHAKKRKLSIYVDRRQSFGFLRPTLTDVGELNLRLSFGLEPPEFNEVVIESLHDLYVALLSQKSFPEVLKKMKSEDKQWVAGFEAQNYLEQSDDEDKTDEALNKVDNVKQAFKKYLDDFVVADKRKVTDFNSLIYKINEAKKITRQRKNNFNSTCLFALLSNLVKYAINFVTNFDTYSKESELHHFKQNYWHSLLKLYQHCNSALDLLDNIDKYEQSYAYAEANTYVDNITEYLIVLDSLYQIQLKMQGNLNYRYKLFRTTEQIHVAGRFDLVPSQVDTYLVDSGQQANVMSLFAMDLELSQRFEGDDTRGHNTVYNYEKSYFELEAFLKDVGGLENFNEETATIVFIDIMQLAKFSFSKFKELKALVIDTTRQPEFNNKELKQIVKDAQKEGIWVVFTSSCLKHDELGQDKYTAGKITILAPKPEDKLDKSVLKELDGVSKDGRNIPVVSYLQMVNEICRDRPLGEVEAELNKNLQLKEKTKIGLQRYGLFAEKKDDEVATLNRTHRLQ